MPEGVVLQQMRGAGKAPGCCGACRCVNLPGEQYIERRGLGRVSRNSVVSSRPLRCKSLGQRALELNLGQMLKSVGPRHAGRVAATVPLPRGSLGDGGPPPLHPALGRAKHHRSACAGPGLCPLTSCGSALCCGLGPAGGHAAKRGPKTCCRAAGCLLVTLRVGRGVKPPYRGCPAAGDFSFPASRLLNLCCSQHRARRGHCSAAVFCNAQTVLLPRFGARRALGRAGHAHPTAQGDALKLCRHGDAFASQPRPLLPGSCTGGPKIQLWAEPGGAGRSCSPPDASRRCP